MMFNKIDLQTWSRKQSYDHYLNDVPCTYSMTVNLDITKFIKEIKENKLKIFPAILYGISHIVNNHKEFRMDIDEEKNIGYYSLINPCYSVFHNETETITNVWTEYNDNFALFMQNYQIDMLKYQNDFIESKPLSDKNYFNDSLLVQNLKRGFCKT